MEKDEDLANRLENFIAEPEENSLEVVSKDGNIINLDFKTKTRGEA